MTTASKPEQYDLPAEAQLQQWAAAYFPEFDPNVCSQGINALAAEGDTAIIERAAAQGLAAAQRFDTASLGEPNLPYAGSAAIPQVSASDPVSESTALWSSVTPWWEDAAAENSAAAAPAAAHTQAYYRGVGTEQGTKPQQSVSYAPVVVSQSAAQQGGAQPVQAAARELRQPTQVRVGPRSLDSIRADFPILQESVNSHPLIWFDNGATTQRPQQVIDRLSYYYLHENSNVHRGAHELAARSTDAYEDARQKVADFIGAPSKDNIVWVRGTTEGINLVAAAFVRPQLKPGDEIILSLLEHHANIVPWQLVAQQTGAVLKVIPVDEAGDLNLKAYESLFTPRTRFVSVTEVSNTLGTITPVPELVQIAHRHGVPILIDGAQSAAHLPVNVTASGADFYVFSGHKIYGPNGIGAVYGRKELWEQASPYQGGGNMIRDVTFERTVYNEAPAKFEAGTGSIADAVGLGAALDYLTELGMANVAAYEHELTQYAVRELKKVKGLHLIGAPLNKSGVLSFVLDGYDVTAVGEHLNRYGIAVRAGHHCAQPVLRHFGVEGTVRPVLGLYNTPAEVDELVRALYALV